MNLNEHGQSLLEIVIAVGLALIISTGLIITTVNGLKNSQFSKNQAQATKYAQEAIDQVRSIRDRDYAVCGPSPVTKFSDLWPADKCITTCIYTIKNSTTDGYCPGDTKSPIWLKNTPPENETIGNFFSRQVLIETFGVNQKKVTVKVTWTDLSGLHESQLATVLTNN